MSLSPHKPLTHLIQVLLCVKDEHKSLLGRFAHMKILPLPRLVSAGSLGLSAAAFYSAAEIRDLSPNLRPLFPNDSDTFELVVAVTLGFVFLLIGCVLLFRRKRPSKSLQPTPGSGGRSATRFTSLGPAWLELWSLGCRAP